MCLLKTTSICIVEADGSAVWEGKAESEPTPLVKALLRWRGEITLVGIEACPLSEWLYGALVESGFQTDASRSKKWSTVRAWGVKLAKPAGAKKACVAVARKLAIIMHRMWVEETDFRFGQPPTAKAA